MNHHTLRLALLSLALTLGTAAAQGTGMPGFDLPGTDLSETDAPAALPTQLVSLRVSTPAEASETIVFQPLPAGLMVLPGTSTLDGTSIPEPLVSRTGVYFILPGAAKGELRFTVQGISQTATLPIGGLMVRYPQGGSEVLTGTVDPTDLATAKTGSTAVAERAGIIRSPQEGLTLRGRSSVDVTLDVPIGQSIQGALSVNGVPVPDNQVGENSLYADGHTRLKYIAVPLKPGVNTLSAFGDTVQLTASGAAASLAVAAAQPLIADGSTPLTFDLDVRDELGNPASLPSVSLTTTGSEPLAADPDLLQSGYQVVLNDGRARLTLRPLSQPGTVTLVFDVNGHSQTVSFQVTGDQSRLMVVHSGGVISGGQASFQGAASIEAPIAGGKLYVAANSEGVNQDSLPYSRYPAYGDASVTSQPLRAQGKLALRLALPHSHAEFGQDAAQDPVFSVQTGADGLNFETNGPVRFGASLTQVQEDQLTVILTPDGTRVLRLPTVAIPGSETVTLVRSLNGVEVGRRTLNRGSEYVLGGEGLIEFPAPLLPVTPAGEDVRLLVSYRSGTGTGAASTTAGVHLTKDFTVGAATGTVTAGAVLIHDVPSFGVHANLDAPGGYADGVIGASGGAVYSTFNGNYRNGSLQANLAARYEGNGYTGPGAGSPGNTVGANVQYLVSPQFGVKATLSGNRTDTTLTDGTVTGTSSFIATAGVTYTNLPFHAEFGLRRNFTAGSFGVQALVGYTKQNVDVSLAHAQDFGAGQSLTTLTTAWLIRPELKLSLIASRDWNAGTGTAGLTLTGARNGVNYLAGYDLPSEGGSLGRARLAATTSIPLSKTLSTDLAASASADQASGMSGSLGATLRYQDPGTQGSLGADAALSSAGLKFDVKAAVNVSYGLEWTLSADALSEFGDVKAGNRFGVGLAWRGDNASALSYLRFRSGSFGEDRFTGEVELEQRPDYRDTDTRRNDTKVVLNESGTPIIDLNRSRLELKESLAFAVPLSGSAPTVQGTVNARYWVNDRFALGAGVGAFFQTGTPLSTRLGLEATVVPFPGWGVTAGYNVLGFTSDLGKQPMRQGAYVKLDLLIDEIKR